MPFRKGERATSTRAMTGRQRWAIGCLWYSCAGRGKLGWGLRDARACLGRKTIAALVRRGLADYYFRRGRFYVALTRLGRRIARLG
jgi:hypothetical protein